MKKRLWIPVLGWILCYGFLHNCLIAPITGLPVVDWEYLLTAMGILLGVSGVRDIGLKERKKQDVASDNKPLE